MLAAYIAPPLFVFFCCVAVLSFCFIRKRSSPSSAFHTVWERQPGQHNLAPSLSDMNIGGLYELKDVNTRPGSEAFNPEVYEVDEAAIGRPAVEKLDRTLSALIHTAADSTPTLSLTDGVTVEKMVVSSSSPMLAAGARGDSTPTLQITHSDMSARRCLSDMNIGGLYELKDVNTRPGSEAFNPEVYRLDDDTSPLGNDTFSSPAKHLHSAALGGMFVMPKPPQLERLKTPTRAVRSTAYAKEKSPVYKTVRVRSKAEKSPDTVVITSKGRAVKGVKVAMPPLPPPPPADAEMLFQSVEVVPSSLEPSVPVSNDEGRVGSAEKAASDRGDDGLNGEQVAMGMSSTPNREMRYVSEPATPLSSMRSIDPLSTCLPVIHGSPNKSDKRRTLSRELNFRTPASGRRILSGSSGGSLDELPDLPRLTNALASPRRAALRQTSPSKINEWRSHLPVDLCTIQQRHVMRSSNKTTPTRRALVASATVSGMRERPVSFRPKYKPSRSGRRADLEDSVNITAYVISDSNSGDNMIVHL